MKCFILLACVLALCALVEAGCLGGLANCLRKKDTTTLDDFDLASERKEDLNPEDIDAAFRSVDAHLKRTVPNDDLKENFREINKLLLDEMRARKRGKCNKMKPSGKCASKLDRNIEDIVAINALLKLKDLGEIPIAKHAFTKYYTDLLIDLNELALLPIDRKLDGSRTILLTRIDHLIYETARLKAEATLPVHIEYIEWATGDKERRLKNFLDQLLKHRVENTPGFLGPKVHENMIYGAKHLDAVLASDPKCLLRHITDMQTGIKEDEIGIALNYFEDMLDSSLSMGVERPTSGPDRRGYYFDKFIVAPCKNYISALKPIYHSLDFDLQFKNVVAQDPNVKRCDTDVKYHKSRIHYAMCQKLINDKERFIEFLSWETSDK